MSDLLLGFDIGGTKCAVCIGRYKGDTLKVENKQAIPTDLTVSPSWRSCMHGSVVNKDVPQVIRKGPLPRRWPRPPGRVTPLHCRCLTPVLVNWDGACRC